MKRIMNKVTVCVLCTAMIGGICYVGTTFSGKEGTALAASQLKDVTNNLTMANKASVTKSLNDSGKSDKTEKEEVVYVKMNASGEVSQVIVSDWLKNFNNDSTLLDQSDLENITNIKGDETFTTNADGSISWAANGNDIYYQGSTTKELPFDMKLTYILDGEEFSAEDVVGKSGALTIRLQFKGKEQVPFSILSAMTASTDMITNVTAKNAKVISDGDKYIIVGVALCGVQDTLKLESIELPEEIEINCDVTNYDPVMFLNVITTGILSNIELDKDLNMTELSESMDTLYQSCEELKDGTGTLSSSLTEFQGKSEEYFSGVTTLLNGTKEYTDGVAKVMNGVKELHSKSSTLVEGVNSLLNGATSLDAGLDQANTGISSLTNQFKDLVTGSKSMKESLSSLQQLITGIIDGKAKENDVLSQLMQTVENNEKILVTLKAANADTSIISALEKNTTAQRQIAEGLKLSGQTLSGYLEKLESAITQISQGAETLYQGCISTDTAHEQLQSGLSKLTAGSKALGEGFTSLDAGSKALKSGVDQLYTGVTKLEGATSSITNGAKKLTDSSKLMSDAVRDLALGGKKVSDGMNQFYEEGIKELYDKYNDTLSLIQGKLDTLIEQGENYKCFTKLSEEMDGNVKFVVEIQ